MLQTLRNEDEERGFTLIEILIVIVILGILAAIVVIAIGNTRKDSVTAACKTNVKALQTSLAAQNTKNGSYPASSADAIDTAKGALLTQLPTSADYNLTYLTPFGGSITVGGSKVAGGTVSPTATDAQIATVCAGT